MGDDFVFRERVLREQSLVKLLVWLAWPMTISAALNSLYHFVDTIWLGRVGSAALATPTLSWPLLMFFNTIGFGLAASVSALVGQYTGAGDLEKAWRAYSGVFGLYLLLSLPVTAAAIVVVPVYVDLIGMPRDVALLATTYLTILVLGLPLQYIIFLFNTGLQALGDTRTPMKISLASTGINMVLDPLLIFPPVGLGVAGAAIATLLAEAVAAGYAVYSLATGRHGLRVRLAYIVPSKALLLRVARISLPVMGDHAVTATGFSVMAALAAGLGTVVSAAYGIGQALLSLDHMISMPFARATGIVVAQSIGAGLYERAKKAALTGMGVAAGLSTIFMAAIIMLGGSFIALFTQNLEVQAIAYEMLVLFGPSIVFFNVFMVARGVANASGHTLFMSVNSIARLWLLRVTLSYLLAYRAGMGATGLWLGMAISNYVSGAVAAAWVLYGAWTRPAIEKPREQVARG